MEKKTSSLKKSLGLATALFISVPFGTGAALAGTDIRSSGTSKTGVRAISAGTRTKKTKPRETTIKAQPGKALTGSVKRRDNPFGGGVRRDNPATGTPEGDKSSGSINITK